MNKCILSILTFCISLLMQACNAQVINQGTNEKYFRYKEEWDAGMIRHFPAEVSSHPVEIISSKDDVKNNIGFLLYEYNISSQRIDSIIKQQEMALAIKYSSSDSCLLIVNRFETDETYEKRLDVEIQDRAKINRPCYDKLLPVPNFINSGYLRNRNGLKLNEKFNICVIEAGSGKYEKAYNLHPSLQMPSKWPNGYSRGIAFSKEEKTIIYWAIIW